MTKWIFHCKECGSRYAQSTSPSSCPHCKRYNNATSKEQAN